MADPKPSTTSVPPEERERRIAELREKRHRRLTVLAWRSAFIAVGIALVVALVLYWLLTTVRGRDVLLNQIASRLPAGAELTWERAEGPASGPMTLHGVHFSLPRQLDPECVASDEASCEMGEIMFDADMVVLDPALRPLFGRRLRMDAMVVRGATLDLPRSDTPFKLPEWPESLPEIAPPLELQADAIEVDDFTVTRDGAPLIEIRKARGGIDASDGRLHVEHLIVASDRGRFTLDGDYAPADDYRMDLTATAVLPAPTGRTAPSLGLVARGDLAHLEIALAGKAPAPLDATLVLDDDTNGERPRWRLRAKTDALDPGLLTGSGEPSPTMAIDLRASGTSGDMRLEGRYERDGLVVAVQPSQLEIDDQVLTLKPLVVDVLGGRVTARGSVDMHPVVEDRSEPKVALTVNADGLDWQGSGAGTPVVSGDAELRVTGTTEDWNASGTATLWRDGQSAQLRFAGTGDRKGAVIERLGAAMPTGTLQASGRVGWTPSLAWTANATLAGFDPGYFLPDWDGAVNGSVATTGRTRPDDGMDMRFDVQKLGGRLRGRALAGHGTVGVHTAGSNGGSTAYEGDVDLRLGGSHVEARGEIAQRLDVRANFSPLRLDDLLPNADGTLRGTLVLGGTRNAPDIDADLDGSGIAWNEWRAEQLHARGRLPWRGNGGALTVDASGLQAGIAFESLHVDARGSVEDLDLDARASSELGNVSLAGSTDRRAGNWRATVRELRLEPTRGSAWQLTAPAQVAQSGSRWRIGNACLAATDGGTLCANGTWPTGLDIEGRGVPLALLTPYLPERSDGRPWLLHGEFALDATVRSAGNGWRGTARLASASGGMKNSVRSRRDLVGYRDLVLDANFDPQRIQATLGAVINDDGRLDARLATGWDAYAPLSGEIHLRTDELTWVELLSPDIVEPSGLLAGHVTFGGTRAEPTIGGTAQLTDFETEIPALAIHPTNGNVRLDARPDGTARITGKIQSGDGTLNIDGSLGWRGNDTPLVLNVQGVDVLAADTRELRAVVNPDVTVRYAAGEPLDISGTVVVPSAIIDLERLDRGAKVSKDVVILDPVNPEEEQGLATPLALDLTLELGDDVVLNGFGLEGTLDGSLNVTQQPGRAIAASGELQVGGRYSAYGAELEITRGRLVWQGSAIADPLLDISAQREIGDVVAGITVTGRASRPQADVWTDPATDQSQALSYLALGRPLSSANGDESRQLDAASAALSAGGSLLASQIGTRLGLDDAGVIDSRTLGGGVLGIGKYLSPRLYVSYGVSLLGTGQVLTLKYLLRAGFDIEIESSSVESRASVNWRLER